MNNYGQCGLGHRNEVKDPTKLSALDPFEDDYTVEVDGGEHHSICRTKLGCVLTWGLNDECQIGVGDIYKEWSAKEKIRKAEEEKKEEEEKIERERLEKEAAE